MRKAADTLRVQPLNTSAVPRRSSNMILVTGGAGFIGSNFVLDWLAQSDEPVINLDALTYAGNIENLAALKDDARHVFVRGDICDRALVDRLLAEYGLFGSYGCASLNAGAPGARLP